MDETPGTGEGDIGGRGRHPELTQEIETKIVEICSDYLYFPIDRELKHIIASRAALYLLQLKYVDRIPLHVEVLGTDVKSQGSRLTVVLPESLRAYLEFGVVRG